MTEEGQARSPWRLPLTLLACLLPAGMVFADAYGTDPEFWGGGVVAAVLLLLWGFVRSLEHGPVFERPPRVHIQAHPEPLVTRIRWAMGWTFTFAAFYSLYVLALTLLRRSTSFPRYGLSTWGILLIYWVGAMLAGIVLGVLKPLTRYRLGAFVVGAAIGSTVYGTVMVAMQTTPRVPWWLPLIPGVIVGGGLGLISYDEG